MVQSNPETLVLRTEHETRELIRHFKKRKWRYLIIIIIAGIYSFYLFKFQLLKYSSTASFIVNENGMITPLSVGNDINSVAPVKDNFNRIFELINSAATQKHLIKKFNLTEHYGIDSTKEFAYQQTVEILRSNIDVTKSPYNTISVTVHDRYRYLAADMANEIVLFLETLNEDLYINTMQKKIKISQAFVEQLKQDNNKKSIAIDSLIQKLNSLILSVNKNDKIEYSLMSYQQRLGSIVNDFENTTNALINSEKFFNLSFQALNFKSYPTITTVRMAMPAARSIALTSALLSIGIMITTFVILLFQAYIFIHYKSFFQMIQSEL